VWKLQPAFALRRGKPGDDFFVYHRLRYIDDRARTEGLLAAASLPWHDPDDSSP